MKFDNILNTARRESFYIPKGMVIHGSVKTDVPGQIGGIINGDVLVKGKVIVLKNGTVNGDISADELMVTGKINGDIKNCSKLTIQSGAIINGNIDTIEIYIEKDVEINGVITKSAVHKTITNKKDGMLKNEIVLNTQESIVDDKNISTERQAWF